MPQNIRTHAFGAVAAHARPPSVLESADMESLAQERDGHFARCSLVDPITPETQPKLVTAVVTSAKQHVLHKHRMQDLKQGSQPRCINCERVRLHAFNPQLQIQNQQVSTAELNLCISQSFG